jgi:acetyltransferase
VTTQELKVFFEPKSVLVVGASEVRDEDEIHGAFFRALALNISRFRGGKVYGVDLSGRMEKYGKKLAGIPKGIDLAVVALPRDLLKKNFSALLARRPKALILVSGDLEQKQREELSNLAKKGRLLLLGPNATMGVINTANDLAATSCQLLPPRQGKVAVISQDGGLAASMLGWIQAHEVGMSKFVCLGEGLGVGATEMIRHLAHDKKTDVICVYLESVGDGRRLMGAIGEASKIKPLIALKGGLGEEKIFEAALRQFGALQARSIDELFNVAEGLAKQPPMHGDRVAVVTNAPGHAGLIVRSLANEGLIPSGPSAETSKKILSKYPHVNISDYLNLGARARADLYKFVGEQLLSDETIDGVVVTTAIKSTLLDPKDVRELSGLGEKSKEKPVVLFAPGGEEYLNIRGVLADTELPVYDQPEKAARVMRMLRARGKILEKIK